MWVDPPGPQIGRINRLCGKPLPRSTEKGAAEDDVLLERPASALTGPSFLLLDLVPQTTLCKGPCTAGLDSMGNACQVAADNFCNIQAANSDPISGTFPKYDGESGTCVPDSCNSDYGDALAAYYKYKFCGAKWQSPDCKVQLVCWYQVTSSLLLPILGGVIGLFALTGCLIFAWVKWDKRRARLRGEGGDEQADERLVDDSDSDEDGTRSGGGGGGTASGQAGARAREADAEGERDSNTLLINYGEEGL
jgi:hypothetical protein